ncbi:hypothetical protein PhCBS80983_g04516 [Powellomyces hirtus]|uniref:FZ domain-containing protein n=1 Tax=Powellomyces hirtus TaxID=109895 RepID=A0A507DXM0_9FUNG|nr:hypothetical protein PhCBS80983_g04516 [Powellomyces hirtus]
MSNFNIRSFIFATILVASVLNEVSADAVALTALCTTYPKIPACDLYASCTSQSRSSGPCDTLSLTVSACADPLALGASQCTSANTAGGTAVPSLPTAKDASGFVASICMEMPDMSDCQGANACPSRNTTTLVSDCKSLSVYGALCLEMPNMNQCTTVWKTFCSSNANIGPYCGPVVPGSGSGSPNSGSPSSSAANLFVAVSLALLVFFTNF